MIDALSRLGQSSLAWLWLPTLAWTVCAGAGFLWLRSRTALHPLYRYRLGQALLFALPATVLVAPAMPVGLIPGTPQGVGPADAPVARVGEASTSGPDAATLATRGETAIAGAGEALRTERGAPGAATRATGADAGARGTDRVALIAGLSAAAALALAVGHLVLLFGRLADLRRLARTAGRITDPDALGLLDRLRERLAVRRPVALLEGPEDSVPITFGWRTPAIIVPARMTAGPQELSMALMHELVHVSRADFVWAVAERVTCALFAFNPLTGALAKGIARDREASCDTEVLGAAETDPYAYANLLYSLGGCSQPRLGVAAGLATPASHLKERIETMKTFLNDPASPRLRARSVLAAVVLLTMTTLLGGCFTFREAADDDEGQGVEFVYDGEGQPANAEAMSLALARLGAQIAYLEGELEAFEDATRQPEDWSHRDRTRYGILDAMYREHVHEYELIKMEQIAASVTR